MSSPDNFSGPDPLWRDVLNCHQTRPFHVMIGGGDQIYNDAVMSQSPLFREWLEIKNPRHKQEADFTPSMREELETFYLERYSMWFSQGLFGMANSQIPMVNMWDDHGMFATWNGPLIWQFHCAFHAFDVIAFDTAAEI